jgi:hypothetical protein
MLTDLHETKSLPEVTVRDIDGDTIFREGLEYSSPARGTWTIAHVPMLIPHSHEVFIGCGGCMRGVVLSAAEFGGLDRFSMITIKDENLSANNMEEIIIGGVKDILTKLPSLPPCVVIFTSCIHEFMYCDLGLVFSELKKAFPGVDFIRSSMNPTMRKSGITPEELMRKQLYAPLEMTAKNPKSVSITGNCYARSPDSEIVRWLSEEGYTVRDICTCTSYEEYKRMAESTANIYTIPLMAKGAEELEKRLGQEKIYLETSFSYERIEQSLEKLINRFHLHNHDYMQLERDADTALMHAHEMIGDTPVAIDYAAVSQPLQLAQLLLSHDFNVKRIYMDHVLPGDEEALAWLKEYRADLAVYSAVNFQSRFIPRTEHDTLAVGQKAAYFSGTDRFVNIVENGDLWGFSGICRLAAMMEDAFINRKNMREVIQVKAWGCRG